MTTLSLSTIADDFERLVMAPVFPFGSGTRRSRVSAVTPPPSCSTVAAHDVIADALLSDGVTLARAFGPGGWVPVDIADPYPSDALLREGASRARRGDGAFLVSGVELDGAMMGRAALTRAFRAHHDACHVVYGASAFCPHGEALATLAQVHALGLDYGSRAACLVFWEILGQTAYFCRHGKFPTGYDMTTGRYVQPTVPVTDETRRTAYLYLTQLRDALGTPDADFRVRSVRVWRDAP